MTVPIPPVAGSHAQPRPIPADPDDVPDSLDAKDPLTRSPLTVPPVPVEVPPKDDLDLPDFLK
jgi:cell division protein FtsZ